MLLITRFKGGFSRAQIIVGFDELSGSSCFEYYECLPLITDGTNETLLIHILYVADYYA